MHAAGRAWSHARRRGTSSATRQGIVGRNEEGGRHCVYALLTWRLRSPCLPTATPRSHSPPRTSERRASAPIRRSVRGRADRSRSGRIRAWRSLTVRVCVRGPQRHARTRTRAPCMHERIRRADNFAACARPAPPPSPERRLTTSRGLIIRAAGAAAAIRFRATSSLAWSTLAPMLLHAEAERAAICGATSGGKAACSPSSALRICRISSYGPRQRPLLLAVLRS